MKKKKQIVAGFFFLLTMIGVAKAQSFGYDRAVEYLAWSS